MISGWCVRLCAVVSFRWAPATLLQLHSKYVENFVVGRFRWLQYGYSKCFSRNMSSFLERIFFYFQRCTYVFGWLHCNSSNLFACLHISKPIACDEKCVNGSIGRSVRESIEYTARSVHVLVLRDRRAHFCQICVITSACRAVFACFVAALFCGLYFGAPKIGRHQVQGQLAHRVIECMAIGPNQDITTTTATAPRQIR